MFKSFIRFLTILFILFIVSCDNSANEGCPDPDATNFNPDSENYDNCKYFINTLYSPYSLEVIKYPLQPSEEGVVYGIDFRDGSCYESEEPYYKYVEFYSLQSPIYPSSFCLLIDNYMFKVTEEMGVTWVGAKLTGEGIFEDNGDFEFKGTVKRSDETEYPIILKGKKDSNVTNNLSSI